MILLGLISAPVLDFTHIGVQALLILPFVTITKIAPTSRTYCVPSTRPDVGVGKRSFMDFRFFFMPTRESLEQIHGFRKLRYGVGHQVSAVFDIPFEIFLLLTFNTFYINMVDTESRFPLFIYAWTPPFLSVVITLAFILAAWYALSL